MSECHRPVRIGQAAMSSQWREAIEYVAFRLPQAFAGRVKLTAGGCIEWTGEVGSGGYGRIDLGSKRIGAHRIAWSFANRTELSPNLYVCHKCDNPPCVNPDHLFIGTANDNRQDCIRKGRAIFMPPRSVCPRGHSMADAYVVSTKRSRRTCRLCLLARYAAYRDRKRANRKPAPDVA